MNDEEHDIIFDGKKINSDTVIVDGCVTYVADFDLDEIRGTKPPTIG
jgi:hypothetical protein